MDGIMQILDQLASWSEVQRLEFLIAPGDDPMMGLQVNLDRQTFSLDQKPSQLCGNLESQTIYSFSKP
jgi:3,4-dihydroxy 2-butanone 4-phosphate synthase/GTP cyclohydrolase II